MSRFPQLAVGAVVRRGTSVLLVQRASEPAAGQWAIPGGKVRPGESLQQAAEREIQEETGVTIRAAEPIFCFDLIERDDNGDLRYHYVIVDLLAEYVEGEPSAADDALDAAWIAPEKLAELNLNATTRQLLARLAAGTESNNDDKQ
ncbi:MAG: NUDIX hydrolase [Thiohalophilus sp.]|jgi:ADP-ribose pyrophosphatase